MDLIAKREGIQPQQRKKWASILDAFGALVHKWGKNFFHKNCPSTQAPISQGLTRRSGRGQNPYLCFSSIFKFSTKF